MDFTNCPRVAGKAYNGANGKKIAVSFHGETWILKFPSNAKERPNEQSYSNSCFSEHIGSSIFRLLGIPTQETILGTHVNGKIKIVCACKDFTRPGVRLYDFCSIKNTVMDTGSGGTGTELSDVIASIEQQDFVDPTIVLKRFWQMFVVDALLGNFDRHNGNWGFLTDEFTGQSTLAPVFDCGSCLLPQADDTIMARCIKDKSEMDTRIFTFPSSMLKIDGHKINYYDFLVNQKRSAIVDTIYKELSSKIHNLDFVRIINNTPYLSSLQQEFYSLYLLRRREILFP